MRLFALDIGMKRTGIAFVDTDNDIPLPLDTIVADDAEEMLSRVMDLIEARHVEAVVIGLPLLPSGDEGSQVEYVRECGEFLEEHGVSILYLDERYTTSQNTSFDGDARAACSLLQMYLERR